MGVQQMTRTTADDGCGVLESLSPEMARELGDAFSVEKIGSQPLPVRRTEKRHGVRDGAKRIAGQVAALVVVSGLAVGVTAAALYFMHLS